MSKFPPKPSSGHLWEGELTGWPIHEIASAFLSLGEMHGEYSKEQSCFVPNDVLRFITEHYLDLKQLRWIPYQAFLQTRHLIRSTRSLILPVQKRMLLARPRFPVI